MWRRRRSGSQDATGEEGADVLGDVFHQMAQLLERLQEGLRLQEQERERRLQETLRLQEHRTATVLGEVVRQMEQKLQEKDDAIRALQQRLQEVQERVAAVEEGAMASERGVEVWALQLLDGRVQKVEASLQTAMDKFFPHGEGLLRPLVEPSPPEEPHASNTDAREPATTGGAASGALEEEHERQRVQLRVREATERRDRARASPCPLGEELCNAGRRGKLSDVRRLLDSGADVNYTNRNGFTSLMCALWAQKNVHVVSLLLERGADIRCVTSFGVSALHFASRWDRGGQCVPLLVAEGANVDARDLNGATPLHWAALNGNEGAARALVAAGARRNLKGWGGFWKDKMPFEAAPSAAVQDLLRL